MSVELPNELVWVLGAIGVSWPNVDEDELRAAADDFRRVADQLADQHADAAHAVRQMLAVNASASLEAFEALWGKASGEHLRDLGAGIRRLADAVSLSADILERAKNATIAELAACAAMPEAVATPEAAATPEAVATREAVRGLLDQAAERISRELKEAMTDQVAAAFDSAADKLGGHLLGGTHVLGNGHGDFRAEHQGEQPAIVLADVFGELADTPEAAARDVAGNVSEGRPSTIAAILGGGSPR